jgi:hypothetical protein
MHPVAWHTASAQAVSGTVNFCKAMQEGAARQAIKLDWSDFDTALTRFRSALIDGDVQTRRRAGIINRKQAMKWGGTHGNRRNAYRWTCTAQF